MSGFKGMSFTRKSITTLSNATNNLRNICDAARIVVGDLNNDNKDDIICLNNKAEGSTFRLSDGIGFSKEYPIVDTSNSGRFGRAEGNLNDFNNSYTYVGIGHFKPSVFTKQILLVENDGFSYKYRFVNFRIEGNEPNLVLNIELDGLNDTILRFKGCNNGLFYQQYVPSVYQEFFPKGDFDNDGTEDLLCVTVRDGKTIAPWFMSFNNSVFPFYKQVDIVGVECKYDLPYYHFPVSTDDANHIGVLKTTIRTTDLNGDGYTDVVCTNKLVHSNTHVEATSHSFLNQGINNKTIKMVYGGVLLEDRYDHHFIEFNGNKGADLLTIFQGSDIKYKVYSDGAYIGPDEVEPDGYGNIPFHDNNDRCFADKVVTGDFSGDGRKDFLCLTASVHGSFEKDHSLVGISDEGVPYSTFVNKTINIVTSLSNIHDGFVDYSRMKVDSFSSVSMRVNNEASGEIRIPRTDAESNFETTSSIGLTISRETETEHSVTNSKENTEGTEFARTLGYSYESTFSGNEKTPLTPTSDNTVAAAFIGGAGVIGTAAIFGTAANTEIDNQDVQDQARAAAGVFGATGGANAILTAFFASEITTAFSSEFSLTSSYSQTTGKENSLTKKNKQIFSAQASTYSTVPPGECAHTKLTCTSFDDVIYRFKISASSAIYLGNNLVTNEAIALELFRKKYDVQNTILKFENGTINYKLDMVTKTSMVIDCFANTLSCSGDLNSSSISDTFSDGVGTAP